MLRVALPPETVFVFAIGEVSLQVEALVCGAGVGVGVMVLAVTRTWFRLKYCTSEATLTTCVPCVIGIASLLTHWKVFQPPVIGTFTLPLTLTPSTSMWNAALVE